MKLSRQVGAGVLAAVAMGAAATSAAAATVSISPSTFTAGKTVSVTLKAPGCSSYDILVDGGILKGPADLIDSGQKAAKPASHKFQGLAAVKSNAAKGSHTLTVRCGGGLYGTVKVKVVGTTSSGGSHTPKPSGLGTLTLQIGKTYATSGQAADGDKVGGALTIHWSKCIAVHGKQVILPHNALIYNANGDGWPAGAEFKLTGGAFKDARGIYVSPLLKTGTVTENLACENQFGLVLRHGKLKVKLVRTVLTHYRSGLSPQGAFLQLAPGLNGIGSNGLGDPEIVSVPACRDGKALLTMTSAGLSPNSVTVQNHHIGVTDFEGWETHFEWDSLTAVATPGNYPITLRCGSGTIATGTLRVAAS